MSTTTTNYGLIKPDTTDPILIGQLNDNADAIDAALKENADAIENKPDAADIPTPSTAAPAMDGTGSAGTSDQYARADHVHPSDTSKQDALSAAQLAAVNSGIDSEKVAQIETNKNNISLLTQYGGGRNVLSVSAATTSSSILDIERIPAGTYKFHCDTDAPSYWSLKFRNANNTDIYVVESRGSMSPNYAITVTLTEDVVKISPWWQGSGINGLTNMYLCRETEWTTPYVYQPYAMSNAELTAAIQAIQAQLANQ